MAVILQRVVGRAHAGRFYPDFAGVARSQNDYATPPLRTEDGIAAVALGLGRLVVEGGNCLRFCPRHPRHAVQFASVREMLKGSQREFWAVDMERREARDDPADEALYGLDAAEADGTLTAVASTYSAENDAVYDGISRSGQRLVSFAPILKHGRFPLAEILDGLLGLGTWGMGGPVEIEFAVNLGAGAGATPEFGVLQMRPLAPSRAAQAVDLTGIDGQLVLCRSESVLGSGRVEELHDVVVVDRGRFDRAHSRQVAQELARFNAELTSRGTRYLLIGVGRWGSADPWLGIPVTWEQISGARVIVEAGFADLSVAPSQGTHFFQHLSSFDIGYFTVNAEAADGFVDWDWLAAQPALRETSCVRHLRFDWPLVVRMDGRSHSGVITKS
jgi:hypothetical protein